MDAELDPEIKRLVKLLYGTYCISVGGKAFNGDLLPHWEDFAADENKRVQSNAWITTAEAARDFYNNMP